MQSQFLVKVIQFVFKWGVKIAPGLTGFLALHLFGTPPRPKRKAHRLFETARISTLSHNHKTIQVYQWQPNAATNGPAVMLIHGWGGSSQSWLAMVKPLLEAGFNVVTFDGPAHGASGGKQTNLIEFSACVRYVAEQTGPLYALMGHSFGGMSIGYVMANHNGTQNLETVEQLVLISTPNQLTDILDRFAAQLHLTPKTQKNLIKRIENVAGQPVDTFSTVHCLDSVSLPTLVIHDTQDKEIPFADGQTIASQLPDAQLYTTEGLGHRRIIRDQTVARAIVRFLENKK